MGASESRQTATQGASEIVALLKQASVDGYLSPRKLQKLATLLEGREALELSSSDIGPEGVTTLAKALGRIPWSLRNLNLWGNKKLGANGAAALSAALCQMRGLESLIANGCDLNCEGATALAKALSGMTGLRVLELSANDLEDEGTAALVDALCMTTGLQKLNLTCNKIGGEGASALSEAVARLPGLQELNLFSNCFGPEGAAALAEGFAKTPKLCNLSMGWCQLGVEGAAAVAGGLSKLTGLQVLNLSVNDFGDEGISVLAGALKGLVRLRILTLYNNKIGDDGAKILGGLLSNYLGLEMLMLQGNDVGVLGARSLAGALGKLANLDNLHLEDNRFGEEGVAIIAEALLGLPNLRSLEISGISAKAAAVMPLARLRLTNSKLRINLNQECERTLLRCVKRLEREREEASIQQATSNSALAALPQVGAAFRLDPVVKSPSASESLLPDVFAAQTTTVSRSEAELRAEAAPSTPGRTEESVVPSPLNPSGSPSADQPSPVTPSKTDLPPDLWRRLQLLQNVGTALTLNLAGADLQYLGRVLRREGDLQAIEDERGRILKDARSARYYQGLQQALCWLFTGARAYKSGLVEKGHGAASKALIQASSHLAGLLPVYGHLAQGAVETAGRQLANYFEGKSAERIARAGGSDEPAVAEGVSRLLVFARTAALSKLPLGNGQRPPPFEKDVAKIVRQDVGRMVAWLKGESDLGRIRDDADLTGERVVRRLVEAAEPAWGNAPVFVSAKPPVLVATPVAPPSTPGAGAGGSGVRNNDNLVGTVEELLAWKKENARKLRASEEELKRVHARLQTLEAERLSESSSMVAASDGQLLMQVRVESQSAGSVTEEAGGFHIEYEHVQQLGMRLAAVEERVDYNERLFAKEVAPRVSKYREEKQPDPAVEI